jgi:hypothetical protein
MIPSRCLDDVDRVTEADVLPLDRYITASGLEADIRLLAAEYHARSPQFSGSAVAKRENGVSRGIFVRQDD